MPLFLAPVVSKQAPLITLEVPTSRLEKISSTLSKALGEPVVIATPLLNDTVTISVKDVTKGEFMKKLATAANASWVRKENFLLFEQTSEQQRAEREYSEKEKFRRISEAVEQAKKQVSKMIAFDENEARSVKRELEALSKIKPAGEEGEYDPVYYGRINRLDRRGPYSRFTKRLVTRLTPQMIMPLSATNRRVVYSNNPTGMQMRLPIKIDDLWAQLVNEQAIWSDVTKSTPVKSSRDTEYISYGFSNLAYTVNPASSRTPTVHIKFATDATGINVNAQISIYGEKGRSITSDYQSLSGEPEEAQEEDIQAANEARKKTKEKIVLSAEAEEYRQFITRRQSEKRGPIAKNLLEKLLHPEDFEAAGQYQLENFKAMIGSRNLIAYNLGLFGDYLEGIDFLRTPYTRKLMEMEDSEKWFTMTIKDRFATRAQIVDPRLIGPMVRLASTRDCATIEEESDFAARLPENEAASWQLQERINRVRPYDLPVYNDRTALRLYAYMDQNIKKAIFSGQKVPLQKLGDRFARELFKSVFWADWANWNFDYQAFQTKEGGFSQEFNELQNQVYGGILQEPTNMCPEGLQPEMLLKGSENTSEVLLADPDGTSQYQQVRQLDPNYLGQMLFQQKNPTKYPWANQPYDRFNKNSIRVVSQRSISFDVTVRKGISKSFNLTEMHVTDPKIYTVDTLPEAIKKKVQEGYKQAEESDKYYNGSEFRRGSPPPPPPL